MILPDKASSSDAHLMTTLPLLPVRDLIVFPHMMLPLTVGREKSIRALEEAMASHRRIFVAAQKTDRAEEPQPDEIYDIGTVAEILQLLKMPDGKLKILVEGRSRARILRFAPTSERHCLEVEIEHLSESIEMTPDVEALCRQCTQLFEQFVKLDRRVPLDTVQLVSSSDNPARLTDLVASNVLMKDISEKQALLEMVDPKSRLERLIEILSSEIQILTIQKRIDMRVRSQIEKTQKEYYLNEQMKAIQKELRQKDDHAKDLDDLREKIQAAKMSKEATEVAEKELNRLEKMMPLSPEATVVRTYLEWLINLPWSVTTTDNLDIHRAEKIMDEDHYGLEKPKERILEYLAVLKLVKKIKGPILCFAGPPGVGKTSIARSIARAMERNFVKMSLGGVRDEAEIRGHRRTYIGSMPGRLMRSLSKAKSKNPVFLLDEIDKMGMDWRGDPAAALLEVLDPEQNHAFIDHFFDVEFDLSDTLFICTANSLDTIPSSLRDRLEIIRFSAYTEEEKHLIAQKYLIPKQMKEHGISPDKVTISESAIRRLIREYTREAGVRSLERQVGTLCRKAAKILVSGTIKLPHAITEDTVSTLLGVPEFSRERAAVNSVGVSTGLAWTEHGGELLGIEVVEMPGKGKLLLTGKLGEVMQESAQAALSFIRANAKKWRIKSDLFKNRDYHIHVPEGATPKDGPSAGIAMATALISAMTGRAVKKNIAMTGEITLHGRVLPIGGLKEKSIAAYREGISTVLYPEGNRKDLGEIPDDIKKHLKMIPLKHMDEVCSIALERKTL